MATKKTQEQVFMLPEVRFDVMQIKLVGTSALVTHPFPLKAMKQIEDKQKGAAKTTKHDIRNPWEDFICSLYWLTPPPAEYTEEAFNDAVNNGARFGFHVGGVKNSAIAAAYRRGLVKNAVTARGMFQIINTEQDQMYFKNCVEIQTDAPPVMRRDCLSTFNSGADMRYRPQFNNWSMSLEIRYECGSITPEQIAMWYTLGGFACGIGENRAEKGEGWGSYTLG